MQRSTFTSPFGTNPNTGLRELSKYKVGQAEVTVYGDYRKGTGRYVIKEPELSEHGNVLYAKLMKELQSSPSVGDDAMTVERLKKEIDRASETLEIEEAVRSEYHAILYRYSREVLGWGRADVLFNDHDLEEITLPRPQESVFVIHRKFSEFNYMETTVRFASAIEADRFVHRMMHRVNRSPSVANPIVDGTNEKGDRYAVLLGEEVSRGSTFSVRKVSRTVRTLDQLVQGGMLSQGAADYVVSILKAKGVVFIIGPTGTGKTTLLNALVNEMPANWKIITIEETPEVQLNHRVWLSMFTRMSRQQTYSIGVMDLVKASLRHRPDMLVVGESRGEEVREMFQAAATGHGLASTFHATDTGAMLSRMTGEPLSVKESFIQLIWAVVSVRNIVSPDGSFRRRVIAIDEIVRDKWSYRIENVFAYNFAADTFDSTVKGGPTSSARAREASQVFLRSRNSRLD
jgi:flagellar protein FlaI